LIGINWRMISNNGVRLFTYFIANALVLPSLWNFGIDLEIATLLLMLINAILYLASYAIGDPVIKESLKTNSLFYTLLLFFSLTFIHDHFEWIYYVYNALFLIAVTVLVFWSSKNNKTFEYRVGLLFWFAFLVYKYYDFVWKLFHKSIALFILGLLFMVVAYMYDRRNRELVKLEPSFLKKKLWIIALVIALQFAVMGVQIAKSEYVLATGDLIKLQLQPIDPRSLIQGDYVILGYEISTIELDMDFSAKEKVQIVLSPNEEGVYEYKGVYRYNGEYNQHYVKLDEDVIVNARSNGGDRLIYGIESFFVPEGTGRAVEGEAEFAYVKVASNGDALLVRLSKD
jgi:uncharacterized membrane-anchored protein